MYGFVEEYPNNKHDTVDIELSLLCDAAAKSLPVIDEKRKWINEQSKSYFLLQYGINTHMKFTYRLAITESWLASSFISFLLIASSLMRGVCKILVR